MNPFMDMFSAMCSQAASSQSQVFTEIVKNNPLGKMPSNGGLVININIMNNMHATNPVNSSNHLEQHYVQDNGGEVSKTYTTIDAKQEHQPIQAPPQRLNPTSLQAQAEICPTVQTELRLEEKEPATTRRAYNPFPMFFPWSYLR